MKLMKTIALFTVSLICLVATASYAVDSPKTNPFKKVLSSAPAAELPAKAAELVKQAKAGDLTTTTISVVKAALQINPAAAPSIVGAIARAVPEMASVAAATAAAEQPKQASVIAMAAATAAPSQVGKIVSAVCRAVPSEYQNIAISVARVAPTANKEILNAVAAAIPVLKPSIDAALAGNPDGAVRPIILEAGVAAGARGPAVGPPYIPLSTTPGNVNPGDTGTVPAGGRSYAAP